MNESERTAERAKRKDIQLRKIGQAYKKRTPLHPNHDTAAIYNSSNNNNNSKNNNNNNSKQYIQHPSNCVRIKSNQNQTPSHPLTNLPCHHRPSFINSPLRLCIRSPLTECSGEDRACVFAVGHSEAVTKRQATNRKVAPAVREEKERERLRCERV